MPLPDDTEAIIRNLARLYAMQDQKREVALLARSNAKIEETSYDNLNGGTYCYSLNLFAPADLYAAVQPDLQTLEGEFLERLKPLLRGYPNEHLEEVVISMELKHDDNWRKNALSWIETENQSPVEADPRIDYDFFISHASEDKEAFVRPLALQLAAAGVRVWFDESELRIGDSLRQSIDHGLVNSRYGVVVLSPAFFAKNWTQYELDGLTSRQMMGQKVILPVWYNVGREEVAAVSPTLADTMAFVSASMTVEEMVEAFCQFLSSQRVGTAT